MSDKENYYYGQDCPIGMVQVESVLVHGVEMRTPYGWKPSIDAMLDIYVDSLRFNIQVGTFHDGSGRRGIHIISDGFTLNTEKAAINAVNVTIENHAEAIRRSQEYRTKRNGV